MANVMVTECQQNVGLSCTVNLSAYVRIKICPVLNHTPCVVVCVTVVQHLNIAILHLLLMIATFQCYYK